MPNNRTCRLILSLVVLVSLLPPTFLVHAQGALPTQVRITPAVVQIPVGQTAEVAAEVVDVQALYGFDISIKFDPNAVEVVDADPAQEGVQVALGTFLEPGFVVINRADNAAGTLRLAMTQLNPSQPKNGTGVLIVVKLRGKVNGASTPLTLTKIDLARRDGTVFTGTAIPGQAQVVPASSRSTPTPLPQQGAGTAMPVTSPSVATPAPASSTATQRPPTLAPTVVAATRVAAVPTRAEPVAPVETKSRLSGLILPLALVGIAIVVAIITFVVVIVGFIVLPRQRKS